MDKQFSQFEDFWEASKLNKYNMPEYSSKLNFYVPDDNLYKLEYPLSSEELYLPKDKLMAITNKRISSRSFHGEPLSKKNLGKLLSGAYSIHNPKSRTYPSAGASYAIEIFALCFSVDGIKTNSIVYYDPNTHGITTLMSGESWRRVKDKVNVETEGSPQVLLLVTIIGSRLTDKYGERGWRFALLEAGAVMQQLSLTVASNKMRGVLAGGMHDDYWINLLELKTLGAKLAFGYLVGI